MVSGMPHGTSGSSPRLARLTDPSFHRRAGVLRTALHLGHHPRLRGRRPVQSRRSV